MRSREGRVVLSLPCLLLAFVFASAGGAWAARAAQSPSEAHFVRADGKAWPQFEPTWASLKQVYGDAMPPRVTIVLSDQGSGGSFDPDHNTINLTRSALDRMGAELLAHETSHLCLAMLTQGASATEAFRFIDEGLAEILGHRSVGKGDDYKEEALFGAALEVRKNKVSLDKVQRWSEFFGNWQTGPTADASPRNWNAYLVGASFDFFLMERYGEAKFRELLMDLGKAGAGDARVAGGPSLDASLKRVVGRTAAAVEGEWQAYLARVPVSTEAPVIVERVPADGAQDAAAGLPEITVRFSVPMNTNVIAIVAPAASGISWKNAYWKSPTVLAIRVPGGLAAGTSYTIRLGAATSPLVSRAGTPLPVTAWSFKTK